MAATRRSKTSPLAALPERYEIRREIGRGASASVYLAIDTFVGREVALKVAHPEIFRDDRQNPILRKAWLNEVRMAGTLHHPYIVDVYDAGIGDSIAYLAMEYLPGGTLEPYTRPDRLLAVDEVLEIAYKCASALDFAGRAGIIHRDIKPANLQYVGKGQAKVADFGAAFWSREDATQVMDIGSLPFVAPEVFEHTVTPQVDIYALGVVLFALLSGKLPFEAKDQATLMYRIIHGQRPALNVLRPDLPAGVVGVVDRMMAPRTEARFADWPAVLAGLSALVPELPSMAAGAPADAELFQKLRRLEVLASLNDAELWQLLRISRWYRVAAGTVLIKEGAEARSCYLLLAGEARVDQEGNLLGFLDAGSLFGELAYAESKPTPRAASITATQRSTIGKWPYVALRAASNELQTKMLQIFFRIAAERIRQIDRLYQNVSKLPRGEASPEASELRE